MAHEPVKFEVILHDDSGAWFNHEVSRMDNAVKMMATTILKESQHLVPYKEGALRKSGRVESNHKQAKVIYGGADVPYAGYQERGKRWDGSHVVKRYTTPGTGAHFLETTGKNVVERGIRWFLSRS